MYLPPFTEQHLKQGSPGESPVSPTRGDLSWCPLDCPADLSKYTCLLKLEKRGGFREWINEIPTVPIYYLAKPQPREQAWQNQRGKKTLLSLTLV
ncbi:hypothetical protein B0F90DRAFT_1661441 [Multifurca ochricompacta]|uniref:Uncharacterized protein n=1 Tax=Multifurca ochricompacta TaxID=376703 RepID=A0AAD4LU08_9AGAM|nr:hypothetical protein B0F90DRAFT_1661441 [Multifurca ochricompacta]